MKKKIFALCGLITVAGLSLASCKPEDGPVDPADPVEPTSTGLDIHINYQATSGVTYRGTTAYANAVDGKNYTQGSLLPTWVAFSNYIGQEIREASSYATKEAATNYENVKARNYESEVTAGQTIDLFMTTTANIKAMGAAGDAVNLLDHLDKMPNYAEWLEKNPTIKAQITTDGKIFYTPYFDGYNDIERMFVMNTELTKTVLDTTDETKYDTTVNGKADSPANVLGVSHLTPFIDADYNYAADQKLKIVGADGKVTEITAKKTANIIKQQNEALAAGATGAQLATQLKTYLKEAYGADNFGEGKLWPNISDFYISEQAAYNTDEMLALFRVVKANPGLITGDANEEVEIFTPRGVANNRVDNMADIIQIFGINGMVSEKEMLYFSPSGELADAATTKGTYDALEYLKDMYQEGLILGDFYYKKEGGGGTDYLNQYFGRTKGDGSDYALMLYDYSASTGAVNDKVDGIGTDTTKRVSANKNVQGVRPILPPFTYWATESNWTTSQDLSNRTGMTLTRFNGENRTLKDGSWCIPTATDNLDAALKLMDYLYGEEGSLIQDYGPQEYWTRSEDFVPGTVTGIFNEKFKQMIGSQSQDFWTFMREYIGSTHGIGCVRSKGLDIQATNAHAQVGLSNLKSAIAKGAVNSGLLDKYETGVYSYDSSVPSAGYPSIAQDIQDKYSKLTSFWSSDKCSTVATGWVAYIIDANSTGDTKLGKDAKEAEYTLNEVMAQMATKEDSYLALYDSVIVYK